MPAPEGFKRATLPYSFAVANREILFLADVQVEFVAWLKITGNIEGSLYLPSAETHVNSFCRLNKFNQRQQRLMELLNKEASNNSRLSILITGRS